MTKQKVIDELRATAGVTIAEADTAVSNVFSAIEKVVRGGSAVRIPGFGTFKMKRRAARAARNPRTGETIHVAERDELAFKETKD